jgi:hypothetical protein
MSGLEGQIDDPNFESARLKEPAVSFSEHRASVTYPTGEVLWFRMNGGSPSLDLKKTRSAARGRADDLAKLTESLALIHSALKKKED